MGAYNVIVCYGVRYSLGQELAVPQPLLQALEAGTEPRVVAAKRVGLKAYWGKVTDGGEHFLLIGTILGTVGAEGAEHLETADERYSEIAQSTRDRLTKAGLHGAPALHIQLEAQY
jgi:hypothetical protein